MKSNLIKIRSNKAVEIIEQVGKFNSMGLMIFNIQLLEFGYYNLYNK